MSSSMRESARAMGELEAACNGFVRRMVSIPRNLVGGFSRAMNQELDRFGIGGRRYNSNHHNPNFHSQQPLNFPFQEPPLIQEEWAFLSTFEQQYGPTHPFFYACRFTEALKIAQDEHKFMFMYIHNPHHHLITPNFCRETLCSEIVVQFLDANFVSWAGLSSRGEGQQMATSLRVSSFPFCAIVAPASADNLAVLRQMEGPVSPAELVEILQRTLEEQLAFGSSGRANLEETRRAEAERRLKEEQDAAYFAALKIDQGRERQQKKPSSEAIVKTQPIKSVDAETSSKPETKAGKKGEVTQILIRFPNGERREHSFSSTDKIQAIYGYIDSLGLTAAGNYRLVSNFPRKVYGADEMSKTLKDAGLNSKASLFLEML